MGRSYEKPDYSDSNERLKLEQTNFPSERKLEGELVALNTLPKPERSREYVWDDPKYFKKYPDGNFPDYMARIEYLTDGVKIFRDVGMCFYWVCEGEDLGVVRAKLSKIPEFGYVKDMPIASIKGFNVRAKRVPSEAWIAIPIPAEWRENVSERDYLLYFNEAIDDMLQNPYYGGEMKKLLAVAGRREVLLSMYTIGRQESGDEKLGSLEFHRYEPDHKAFSFSLFHIVMTGGKLAFRQRLEMTEGQAYHPRNGGKLFLAYVIETMKDRYEKFFPLATDDSEFTRESRWAQTYNGPRWQRRNPNYASKIRGFYNEGVKLLDKEFVFIGDMLFENSNSSAPIPKPDKPKPNPTPIPQPKPAPSPKPTQPKPQPAPQPKPIPKPGGKPKPQPNPEKTPDKKEKYLGYSKVELIVVRDNLIESIKDANMKSSKRISVDSILKNQANVVKLARKVEAYVAKKYKNKAIKSSDKVGVGRDSFGFFVVFRRGNEVAVIRP